MLAQSDTDLNETLKELGSLTAADWLWAGGILLVAIALAIGTRRLVSKLMAGGNPLAAKVVGRLLAALVFVLGLVYALSQVGVSVGPLLGVLGVAGLALALGFQEIIENFIAGVFMSLRQPFGQGDQIHSSGYDGTVVDISLRAVELETYAGERVLIPNAMVWKSPIVNHTVLGRRRTRLEVGVEYGTDLDRAQQILIDAVAGVEGVMDAPPPTAFVFSFGSSSIDFKLGFWHEPSAASEGEVRDRVARAVKKALDQAGIGIPFPQRVVHMVESTKRDSEGE